MSGIREELLKTDKHNVKVKVKVKLFRGGTIEDYIKPILKREPNYIIIDIVKNRNIGRKHLGS